MINLLKDELTKKGVFNEPIPPFLYTLSKIIPNQEISEKMKLTIVVSEIILYCSQFRRSIQHRNGSLIPINAISFAISASGTGKDSSLNAVRKLFLKGYSKINDIRVKAAIDEAIKLAEADKKAHASDPEVYAKYYRAPLPLFASLSTNEGFIAHLNKLDDGGIGAGYIFSGEFGSELVSSSHIIQNIQLLSEVYDEGKKEVKIIKDNDRQSKPIKNLPVSALFLGSQTNLLFNDSIKNKFKVEFNSKLARRSFFNYNPQTIPLPKFNSLNEFLSYENKKQQEANEVYAKYSTAFDNLADLHISKLHLPITISDEANELMLIYKRYNTECSNQIKKLYPITKIVINHLYWKALKLSGALAMIKGRDEILAEDYRQAIVFCELIAKDMEEFENELVKEPYELFCDYAKTVLESDKSFISIHTLKKLGYIAGSSNINQKIKELAQLASSYDNEGIYKAIESGIEYSKIVKSSEIGISYLECSGDKETRKTKCNAGYKYVKTTFDKLALLLNKDYAYTPFEFKDGVRNKDNIISGTKWIALDIDNSYFSDTQMHEILIEFNHHIARTSNKNNANKYRILLELDAEINLNDKEYKAFITSIAKYLGIECDILPKSQILFSYANRDILSVIDKKCIEVKEHLLYSINDTPHTDLSQLDNNQKQALINDPLTTFNYAFEAKHGEGSFSLIRAARHAINLGMDKEAVINLMKEINSYWDYSMEAHRFQTTIIDQINRWDI